MSKPKGLGRGLNALLGDDKPDPILAPAADEPPRELALGRLQPGRYQPRTRMDETALQELAASIRTHGLMQPIVVRPLDGPLRPGDAQQRFEIIAGERRFRAARLASLAQVPVIVREVPDESALALALIENIQREDLNPLEEAQAIRRLLDEFDYTHERASEAIGRSRSATSNLLRLLNLADSVQTMLLAGDLDMGHARALLALERGDQVMVAQEVVQRRLSVRETEKLVALRAAQAETGGQHPGADRARVVDRDVERLREKLCEALAADVKLQPNRRGGGRLTIDFVDAEQFEGVLGRLGVNLRDGET
ncbi:MAG: ParB/RepB/Spo0J family partition protein [Burkholderiaceae bacterium]